MKGCLQKNDMDDWQPTITEKIPKQKKHTQKTQQNNETKQTKTKTNETNNIKTMSKSALTKND